jgi:hypothetical protein
LLRRLGRDVGQGPADHHADDLIDRNIGGAHGGHVATVAHDRDAVGYQAQLFQAMRDVDDAHALLAQVADDAE